MFWSKKEIKIGALGERVANKFLKKKGFKILDINFQNNKGKRVGEIDIVAKKDGEIIFLEVKARKVSREGVLPEENITPNKLRKLQKIAQVYLKEKSLMDKPYHFDAVSVLFSKDSKVIEIRHIENIFI